MGLEGNEIRSSNKRLLQVIYVTRHGMRAPYTKLAYPGWYINTTIWPNGEGMLTDEGIERMFDVGTQLLDRYLKRLNIRGKQILKKEKITVVSSNSPRTISTAKAIVAGLTGKEWNKQTMKGIKKYKRYPFGARDKLNVLIRTADLCDIYQEEILKNIYESKLVQDYISRYDKTFTYILGQFYGTNHTNLSLHDYVKIQDPLYCLSAQLGYSALPDFVKKDSAFEHLNQVADLMFVNAVKENFKLQRSLVGPLVDQIITTLEETVKKASRMNVRDLRKNIKPFHIYSAHDHTLGALMTAFNVSYDKRPGWGSALIMELWVERDKTETGNGFKIVYTLDMLKKDSDVAPLKLIKSQKLSELVSAVCDIRTTDTHKMTNNCFSYKKIFKSLSCHS